MPFPVWSRDRRQPRQTRRRAIMYAFGNKHARDEQQIVAVGVFEQALVGVQKVGNHQVVLHIANGNFCRGDLVITQPNLFTRF